MTIVDWLGAIGVFQILLAYFLNISKRIATNDLLFIMLNIIGSGMACMASIHLRYWPFIILEGVWLIVSVLSLFTRNRIN